MQNIKIAGLPESSLVASPIHLVLSGLIANCAYEVRLQIASNGALCGKSHWVSYAQFQADHTGKIDLATTTPLSGTYSSADAMGTENVITNAASSVVWGGFGKDEDEPEVPRVAWTFRKKPIEPLKITPEDTTRREELRKSTDFVSLTPWFLQAMKASPNRIAARIPVENSHAKFLIISGDDDQLWPSGEFAREIESSLPKNGRQHQVLIYPNAGHWIGSPTLPTTNVKSVHPVSKSKLKIGGNPQAINDAAKDSWEKMIDFLS